MRAREAAGKFIDANAAPNRLIAVVDFGGTVRIAQNFTADAARLKQVVAGLKTSAVSPNAPPVEVASLGAPLATSPVGAAPLGMPSLGNAEADFGARSIMLALRSLAKSLGTVPGRKTLVLLTSGFSITPELQSELTAVISTCNRYNVAVYPGGRPWPRRQHGRGASLALAISIASRVRPIALRDSYVHRKSDRALSLQAGLFRSRTARRYGRRGRRWGWRPHRRDRGRHGWWRGWRPHRRDRGPHGWWRGRSYGRRRHNEYDEPRPNVRNTSISSAPADRS